jgi:hypothetical protein
VSSDLVCCFYRALVHVFFANSVQMDVSRLKSKDARQLSAKVRRVCLLVACNFFVIICLPEI